MNVRLMRAERMETAPKSDRRREPRFAAGLEGTLFLSDASTTTVRIAEISLHGCRVSGDHSDLRAGMFVSIALGDETPLEAIVRWVRESDAGMEFLWPISPDRREWHDLVDLNC